jgi:hypothetical protein
MFKSKDKMELLADEVRTLEMELEKLSAQVEAYEDAFDFADVMAEIAKNAYWGSDRAKEKIQSLIDQYSEGAGIWDNWTKTVKDIKSGDAMRRILAKKIA